MNTFDPQLSQQDLAEMIDREGLAFECKADDGSWLAIEGSSNPPRICTFHYEIRLAPGALTEFGLKPGMVPHNPDGLTAEQITEGGKCRALEKGSCLPRFSQWWSKDAQAWEILKLRVDDAVPDCMTSYRLLVNTPFPKPSRTEPPDNTRVHATHCCAEHGCKYGDDDECPVVTGKVSGVLCEDCEPPDEQSSVTQQAGQTPESRIDQVFLQAFETNHPAMLDWVRIKFDLKKLRTLETELAAALAEKQDFLDTLIAIYDKLGVKEGDVPGGEKVSVTVLRYVTTALAQRDEANRLLREAAESMKDTLMLLQHADFSHEVADSSGYDEGNYIAEKYEKRIQENLTQITNHLKP